MSLRVTLLLLFLTTPVFASDSWQKLDKGLHYQKIEIKKNLGTPYIVHAFEINPRFYDLRPLTTTPIKQGSIRSLVEKSGAVLGVNANFFDPQGKPLGLVVSKGQVLNPVKNISWWGIFSVENNRPRILHSSDWNKGHKAEMALQAGPRLVVSGKIPALKNESSQKTAIGITKKGNVILLVTYYPLPIRELAQLMAMPAAKGGLDCMYALNFDGGSSTQLYAKIGNFELKVPSFVGIPVGLGVFRK